MTNLSGVFLVICILLAGVIIAQCFSMSMKMTATAQLNLKVLVGFASFAAIVSLVLALGGTTSVYWTTGGLATLVILFWFVLRKWGRGMPSKYDTDSNKLKTEP